MTDPAPPNDQPTELPKRRANDRATMGRPADVAPEQLLAALRNGELDIAALAPLAPLNAIFQWHAKRQISEDEFAALLAGLEVHEMEISDLPSTKDAHADAEQQRARAVIETFQARMAAFDLVTLFDVVSEAEMKAVFAAKTPLPDGIGIRMAFARGEEDEPAKPGTPPELTVLCRAYLASTSMTSAIKCEAVFSSKYLAQDFYCRIVAPLPIHRGGRRRLLVSILDNDTRQPINMPPAVAELFHEKHLFNLQLLRKSPPDDATFGSTLIGTIGKLFRR